MSKKDIRKYQDDGVAACLNLPVGERGKVILPTGSGKTYIGQRVIEALMIQSGTRRGVYLINVPRLILAKQWIQRTADELINRARLPIAFVSVNSGSISNEVRRMIEELQVGITHGPAPKIPVTTNNEELSSHVNRFIDDGFNVVILATYHSSRVVLAATRPNTAEENAAGRERIEHVDLVLHDECQYLVSPAVDDTSFMDALSVPADRHIFMTATPRETSSSEGKGMNNVERFGEVIFEKSPREIIEAGAIVSPKMHIIGCDQILEGRDATSRMNLVFEAWKFHKQTIESNSSAPDQIGAKMLVVCDGQLTLQGIFESKRFREIREQNPNLKIYGLSSDFGIYIDDGQGGPANEDRYLPPVNGKEKEEFLAALNALGPDDDAIIFHVDMIAEGLDVPGITGVLPLRTGMSKIKFLQNLGRATRLHPHDAQRIFAGKGKNKLKIGDYKNYIKPHCYVVLPFCLENREDFMETNATIIEAMRTEYGFDPSDNIIFDLIHPAQHGPEFATQLKRQIRDVVEKDVQEFYQMREEESIELEEFLMQHKLRRFDGNQVEQFIEMTAEY